MTTECKGKQTLPYLLSTTKTLIRCRHYYYSGMDFKFNCRRNRDCYTERNVRINMTRMWHNVVLPNAILCSMYGKPTTYREALEALDYSMTHGKTRRSLEAWSAICHQENEAYKTDKYNCVMFKYQRSFCYYALGQAVSKSGLLYELPKKKRFDIKKYTTEVVKKFIWIKAKCWYCPWYDLNRLIYAWGHYEDEYNERSSARQKRIDELDDKIKWEKAFMADVKKYEEEKAMLEKEDEEDECPVFPSTLRAICDEFHVSMTSAQRFKLWMKQYAMENSEGYFGMKIPLTYAELKDNKTEDETEDDFVDTEADQDTEESDVDDAEDGDTSIDKVATSLENSGVRPIGSLEEGDPSLPF